MIESDTEDAPCFASMCLERDRMQLVLPLPDGMRPAESNREKPHELPDFLGIRHVRIFKAEASRLETAEERLDLPALEVGLDGVHAEVSTRHDHVLIRKTGPGEEERHPADDGSGLHGPDLSLGQSPEQIADVALLASREAEVLPDTDAERDLLFLEPGKPCMPHELPISEETGDVLFPQQRDHRPQNGFPLLRVRVPLLLEKHPGDREGGTLVDDGDREDVDVRFSPLPIRPVHREPEGPWRKQGEHELHQKFLGKLEEGEEPLDAAVAGIHLGIPAEAQSDLGEIHGAYRDEGQDELGEELEALTSKREMNTQGVREGLNRPFLEVLFISNWGKSLKGATS